MMSKFEIIIRMFHYNTTPPETEASYASETKDNQKNAKKMRPVKGL